MPPAVRILVAVLAVVSSLATLPTSAFAHAELLGTEPAGDSTVSEHPRAATITFSERVTVPFGAIKAYGPDGSRVNDGEPTADGEVVTIPLETEQDGTYAIAWRVTSGDGHPVRGAFTFNVERESDDDTSRDAAAESAKGSRAKDVAFGVARGGILLGVLVGVGGVLFAALAAGSWQPRWLRTSLLLALASMFASYVLDASIAAGLSIADSLDPAVLREQASTVYGRATAVRILVVLVCVVLTLVVCSPRWQRHWVRFAVVVPFVVLAATLSLSGHAVGESVSDVRLPLDMLHSIAAAAWIGGLVQLVPWSRATPVDPSVIERYSRMAMASVAVLVPTGAWAAYEEIGLSRVGLLDTTYGRLVVVKLALLLAVLPIANLNRTTTVPGIRAGTVDAGEKLRSYVRAEIGILLLVLVATAWLIQTPPAKVQQHPEFVEKTFELGSGGTVQLVVDPAAVGSNAFHLYAFDDDGLADGDLSEISLTAFNDERNLGPLDIELDSAGPGHFTTNSATIPFAGTWRFEVSARRGKFDEERARFTARIAPRPQE